MLFYYKLLTCSLLSEKPYHHNSIFKPQSYPAICCSCPWHYVTSTQYYYLRNSGCGAHTYCGNSGTCLILPLTSTMMKNAVCKLLLCKDDFVFQEKKYMYTTSYNSIKIMYSISPINAGLKIMPSLKNLC